MSMGQMVAPWSRVIQPVMACALVAALLPLGCSAPAPLPPKIATSIKGLSDTAVSLRAQVVTTVGALESLTKKPQADLKPQFQDFCNELGILESRIAEAKQGYADTDDTVKSEFVEWDKSLEQLHDEDSRQSAGERRAATDKTYSSVKQSFAKVEQALTPFMTDLTDVRKYLQSDLSPAGLKAISDASERAADSKDKIIKLLNELVAAVDATLGSA